MTGAGLGRNPGRPPVERYAKTGPSRRRHFRRTHQHFARLAGLTKRHFNSQFGERSAGDAALKVLNPLPLSGRRVFRLSSNPLSILPRRESGVYLDPYSPSFPSQRESRALSPSNPLRVCRNVPVGTSTRPTRRVSFGITVLANNQGSGFPLRRD